MELEGAVCVVTGGTRGIGRAVARDLLAAGGRVAICGRTPASVDEGLAALGATDHAVGSVCDVADAAAVERFAAFVREALGPARVVVNNAGLAHFVPVAETTEGGACELCARCHPHSTCDEWALAAPAPAKPGFFRREFPTGHAYRRVPFTNASAPHFYGRELTDAEVAAKAAARAPEAAREASPPARG